MQHEQVNDKAVALYIKGGKITARLLADAMKSVLKKAREPTHKHGKQSIKSLTKQGMSLTEIEIPGEIGTFKRTARKYNIDFALKRDDAETPPKWIVFFKAKDADAITAAFNEYSKSILKVKTKKKPMLERLNIFKALAKTRAAPAKNKSKGELEI